MAEVLEDYAFPKPGARTKYPYDEWLDGKPRRLRRGTDFESSVRAVVSSAGHQARQRGLRLRHSVEDENTVVIKAEPAR